MEELYELRSYIERGRYADALRLASLESFEGVYDATQLAEIVDEEQIKGQAFDLIQGAQ